MDMFRYRQLFLDEAREHLTRMGQLLIFLERAPQDRETLDALFRQAHSLKSMASTMNFAATTRLAHHLEEVLAQWRDSGAMPAGAIDRLLAGVDLLDGLLDDLTADRPEREISGFFTVRSAVLPPGESAPMQLVYQVTVDLAEDTPVPAARALVILRDLQERGEVLYAAPSAELLRQGGDCRRLQVWLRTPLSQAEMAARLQASSDVALVTFVNDRRGGKDQRRWAKTERTVRVRIDVLDQVVSLSGQLLSRRALLQQAARTRDWGELDSALAETSRLLETLHQDVLQTRLLPLESITGRVPRLVRDLAKAGGKEVDCRLLGGGVLLEREILEELTEPLLHLVRNAVDHGIVAGQPGEVTVSGRLEPGAVLIEVADNGRGLDPDGLKRQALSRGLLSVETAAALGDGEALRLICLPGFSTAPAVTEVSGHGVGMDVVKTTVEKLGGTLELVSAPGAGCRVRLRFPITPVVPPDGEAKACPAARPPAAAGGAQEAGHALS